MAGMTTCVPLVAFATVALLPSFGATSGRSRMAGPALRPTGH